MALVAVAELAQAGEPQTNASRPGQQVVLAGQFTEASGATPSLGLYLHDGSGSVLCELQGAASSRCMHSSVLLTVWRFVPAADAFGSQTLQYHMSYVSYSGGTRTSRWDSLCRPPRTSMSLSASMDDCA